ncbi:MAG: hypothetical protein H0U64_08310 [Gemmatimonadaceae bacterium]|nr:hypothetical protein [Gemmatimonadaceae bacterium]
MIAQVAMAVTLLASAAPRPSTDSLGHARSDPWISPDKAKHFLIAGFVESASFAGLEATGVPRNRAFLGAFAVTGAVSVIREVHDGRTKNQFSVRDLTWDALGGIAAFLVLRHTERP